MLDALGEQYEREHEQQVRDLLQYCPEEARPLQASAAASVPSACHEPSAAAQGSGPVLDTAWLPQVLAVAPRLGTRLLVQENAARLLVPLCGELSSWQAGPRGRCAGRAC